MARNLTPRPSPSRGEGSARVASLGVLVLLLAACDGGAKDDPCPWLSGDNCWKAALSTLGDCVLPTSAVGELSTDGTVCTFPGNVKVTFEHPVDVTQSSPDTWGFTIQHDCLPCLRYVQEDDGASTHAELTIADGTFVEDADRASVDVACIDGTSFSFSPMAMLNCGSLAGMPGISWGTGGGVSVSLLGGAEGPLHLFTCMLSTSAVTGSSSCSPRRRGTGRRARSRTADR